MTDNMFMTETNPHLPENISPVVDYEEEEERPAYLARALAQPGKMALDFSIFLIASLSVLTPVGVVAFIFSIWIVFGGYGAEAAFINISMLVVYLGFVAACITNLIRSISGFSRADRDNPESGRARYKSSIIISIATLAWLFVIFFMSGGGNLIALLFAS